MERFFEDLAEALDSDELAADDILEELEEWDSLGVLSVVAMIDSKYSLLLTAEDMLSLTTANDLLELVTKRAAQKSG